MKKLCSTLAVLFVLVTATAVAIPAGPDVGTYAGSVTIANDTVNNNLVPDAAIAAIVTMNSDAAVAAHLLFGNADNGAFAVNQPTVTVETGQANAFLSGSGSASGSKFAVALVPEVTARDVPNHGNVVAHVALGAG